MSGTWWDESYGYRESVTVPNVGGSGDENAVLVVPPDWDAFWENLQDASGLDAVVVDPNTNQVVTYEWAAGFNKSGRSGTLELASVGRADAVHQLHLYWGKSSPDNLTAAVDPGESPVSAVVELAAPAAADTVIVSRHHRDEGVPSVEVVKRSAEVVAIWVDCTARLQGRRLPYNGHRGLEAILEVDIDVEDGGSSQANAFDRDALRIAGGTAVKALVKSGADDQDLVAIITITTTLGRVFEERVLVKVRDPAEE